MSVTTEDISRLRFLASQRLGLVFDDSQLDHLADVLRERVRGTGSADAATYFQRLNSAEWGRSEWDELANALIVGETYFFRHPDHFRAFAEVALPLCLRGRGGDTPVSILSAGCASGEEPYSLAILASEILWPRAQGARPDRGH